ncbi:MAG: aminotransferase class IV [Chthoniobacterales bacterium]
MPLYSLPAGATLRTESHFFWRWNGQSIVPCDGRVLVRDRGFRYGQHFFETLAIRNKKVLFLKEHVALLLQAAELHQFPFTASCQQALLKFFKNESFSDGLLRIYLTAGEGSVATPVIAPNLLLTWEESVFPTADELKKGIPLVTLNDEVITKNWGEKNGNYWNHVQALEKARAMGAREGVVSGSCGLVISAAMANLLIWMEEDHGGEKVIQLLAPAHACARKGVVLAWVKKNSVMKSVDLSKIQLKRAIALAITNSRWGVMPVATLDGKPLPQPELAEKLALNYLAAHEF